MTCELVRSRFSDLLDGALSGAEMHALTAHLEGCVGCDRDYRALQDTQTMVASLGRRPAPPELAFRIRLALAREAQRTPRRRFETLALHVQNAFQGLMVPATAGVVSTVLLFVAFLGFFAMPAPVQASGDVPTTFYTPPALSGSPVDMGIGAVNGSVVVETLVDENGRVEDYRILSPSADAQKLVPALNNVMIFTTFQPAMSFGHPVAGRVILSFSNVSVKG
jgi:anti-sigma factor RsiW